MSWRRRFRRHVSLLENLWALPVIGAVLGAFLGLIVSVADEHFGAPSLWQYSPSTASAVLTSIVGATAALTGFVVTVTVLVVQMATGTLSARILRLWYRDRVLKATLAVLVGTLTFSFSVLRRIDDDFVPDFGVTLAGSALGVPAGLHRLLRSVHPPAETGGCRRRRRTRCSFDVRADGPPRRPAGHPLGLRVDTRRSEHSSCEPAAAARSKLSIPTASSSGLAHMAPSSSYRTR